MLKVLKANALRQLMSVLLAFAVLGVLAPTLPAIAAPAVQAGSVPAVSECADSQPCVELCQPGALRAADYAQSNSPSADWSEAGAPAPAAPVSPRIAAAPAVSGLAGPPAYLRFHRFLL